MDPDLFMKNKLSGSGRAFGSSLRDRFNYYSANTAKPSPVRYQISGHFGEDVKGKSHNGPNKEYSFGVSREKMIP